MMKNFDEKYTPRTIQDIVYASTAVRDAIEDIVTGVTGFPGTGKNGIIIYGTFGTGKTALAKLLPDAIESTRYGGQANYWEMFQISQGGDNGAVVINKIKASIDKVPYASKYHYYLLDEVDNLRPDSLKSLKTVMNIGASSSIFIFTTNNITKLDGAVISRSEVIAFNAPPSSAWLPKVRKILADYNVTNISDSALEAIITSSGGDAREILSNVRKLIVAYKRAINQPLTL